MTSKNKNILLVVGFVLALVIAYQFAIADTLALRKTYNDLQKEQSIFQSTPQKLASLKQRERVYDSVLNANNIGGSSMQNELLRSISEISESSNLKITAFNEPHTFENENYQTLTYSFSVTGSFNNIQKLLHHLEQKTSFGELVNVQYKRNRDYRKRRNYLEAAILLRRFER